MTPINARPNQSTAIREINRWVPPCVLGNLALMEGKSHRDAAMLAATDSNGNPHLWNADFLTVEFHGPRRNRATLVAWFETAEGPFEARKVGRARRVSAGWVRA